MRLYGHNGPLPRDPPSDGLNSAGDCEPYCTVCRARTLVVFNQKGILKQFRAVTSFRAPPNPRTNSHTSVCLPFLNASGAGSLEGEPVPLFVGLCGLDLVGWAGTPFHGCRRRDRSIRRTPDIWFRDGRRTAR
jgi:hypothetical protein